MLLQAGKAHHGSRATTPTRRPASPSSRKALQAPIRQIAENAGVEGSIVVGKVLEARGTASATTPRTTSTAT